MLVQAANILALSLEVLVRVRVRVRVGQKAGMIGHDNEQTLNSLFRNCFLLSC